MPGAVLSYLDALANSSIVQPADGISVVHLDENVRVSRWRRESGSLRSLTKRKSQQ